LDWFRDYLPNGQLVLDSSAFINLLGSGSPSEILSALPQPCLLEDKVVGEILKHPIPGLSHQGVLDSLVEVGVVAKLSMSVVEYEHFLLLVQAPLGQRLDEGESATLAVASNREMAVVMDERKGRNYAAANFPNVQVISSLKLFISAAARRDMDIQLLRTLLASAKRHARMSVPKSELPLLLEAMST